MRKTGDEVIDTVLKNAAAIARDLIRADANKGPV